MIRSPVGSVEEQAENLAGAVYGTVVVAGVLAAASSYQERPSAGAAAAYAIATVLLLWLVESWAHSLGERAAGAAGSHSFRSSLRRRWPLAQSALPPLTGVGLARILGATHETAITVGVWVCVGLLVAWGATIEAREHASLPRIVAGGAGCGLLGLLFIGLKSVLS